MNASVIKALKLLDLFTSDEKELTLAEIARKSDLAKPTAYRLLTSLEVCGFLIKTKMSDQDIRYKLGLKLLELGNLVMEGLELRKIALPHMKNLCSEIDEVVHLVIQEGNEAVYIEKVESKQNLRLYTRIGKRSPLYVGSGPKLLFAYLPIKERKQLFESLTLESLTPNTITDKEKLWEELNKINEQGFAVSHGEQDANTFGISFPIHDYTEKVIAALGVSGLAARFTDENEAFITEKVREAAQLISKDLGFRVRA
ncbi:IclR family transcriptional regulator [Brevibacillus massiliensis]|jgi:DNA-binding IclR family transcriptional regulator|uniref:IclR family transcriptional regulator n=1 Tax=Brevibacillus massiliensis TaxID=1118054 RepID=UPI00035D2FFC|nr:IclR family transcriptional regulator [Brevibacillus massiliensis]